MILANILYVTALMIKYINISFITVPKKLNRKIFEVRINDEKQCYSRIAKPLPEKEKNLQKKIG
jgi:hypothetical protein